MKSKKLSKLITNKIGLCLIAFASMLVKIDCLWLGGEAIPPKSLLK